MRKLVFAGLAVALAVACQDSSTGTVNAADAGNYVLRSLNDSTLPYTYFNDGTSQLYILADTIFMGVDGRFTDKTYQKYVQSGTATFPVEVTSGTWTEKGATVLFSGSDGSLITANFSGSSLVIVGGNIRAVYTK